MKDENDELENLQAIKDEKDHRCENYLNALVSQPITLVDTLPFHGHPLHYLKKYQAIVACSCVKPFELGALRFHILNQLDKHLAQTPVGDRLRLSVIGSGYLFETFQVIAKALMHGFTDIQLDLFDTKYGGKQTAEEYFEAFQDLARFLNDQGVDLYVDKACELSVAEHLNIQPAKHPFSKTKATCTLRLMGDVCNEKLVNLYQQEGQARGVIAIDVLEAGFNPIAMLRYLRQGLANGSFLLMANKQDIKFSKYYSPTAAVVFFHHKKSKGRWHALIESDESKVVPLDTHDNQGLWNDLLQRFEFSDRGPTPKDLIANKGHGPWADYMRSVDDDYFDSKLGSSLVDSRGCVL